MPEEQFQLSEAITELLFTDFDGNPADCDDVIVAAFDDDRYRTRVPGLVKLLPDSSAHNYDRFIACFALTAWAESPGLMAVITAAENPDVVPWLNVTQDRLYSVNDTFGHLVEAVEMGDVFAPLKGTEPLRWQALVKLIDLADRHYFDRKLEWTLGIMRSDEANIAVRKVVSRGIQELAAGFHANFDVPKQLAGLLAATVNVDEEHVVPIAGQFLNADISGEAVRELILLVSRGKTNYSIEFGERLKSLVDKNPQLAAELEQAFASRKADA